MFLYIVGKVFATILTEDDSKYGGHMIWPGTISHTYWQKEKEKKELKR